MMNDNVFIIITKKIFMYQFINYSHLNQGMFYKIIDIIFG